MPVDACPKEAMFKIEGHICVHSCAEHLGALVDEMIRECERADVRRASRSGIKCGYGWYAGFQVA